MAFTVKKETFYTIELKKDRVRLACTIWLPIATCEGADPVFSSILEYLPYRKTDWTSDRDQRRHTYFASHGDPLNE